MAKAERFFLIVRAPNGDVREVPLGSHALVIGRDESADIRVDESGYENLTGNLGELFVSWMRGSSLG